MGCDTNAASWQADHCITGSLQPAYCRSATPSVHTLAARLHVAQTFFPGRSSLGWLFCLTVARQISKRRCMPCMCLNGAAQGCVVPQL